MKRNKKEQGGIKETGLGIVRLLSGHLLEALAYTTTRATCQTCRLKDTRQSDSRLSVLPLLTLFLAAASVQTVNCSKAAHVIRLLILLALVK